MKSVEENISNETGVILAVCLSEKKGTPKKNMHKAELQAGYGILGDAHAGNWHRQISLLSFEKIDSFNAKGANVNFGDFGENLVVEGIDFPDLPVGSILQVGNVKLRITQLGKECHTHCQIYQRMGECIMPKEGVFAEVLSSGEIKEGDQMKVERPDSNRPFQVAVITLSDKASAKKRVDESGPKAVDMVTNAGMEIVETLILPDEEELLKNELIRLADQRQVDLILTSGGTGFSFRDRTPEATYAVMERNAPGIAEYMRMKSMEVTDRAMLSRGATVIRGKTLIVNLPGSPKAVEECLGFILPTLFHGLKILRGTENECGRK